MSKYLKLGENAHSFHSMGTNLTIANKMVVRVKDHAGRHKDLAEALKTGHLVWATEDEWKAYQKSIGKSTEPVKGDKSDEPKKSGSKSKKETTKPEPEDEDEDEDEELTKSEMIDALKESDGVDEASKRNLTKLSAEELKKLYNTIFKED